MGRRLNEWIVRTADFVSEVPVSEPRLTAWIDVGFVMQGSAY